jgi:hypothetical protein
MTSRLPSLCRSRLPLRTAFTDGGIMQGRVGLKILWGSVNPGVLALLAAGNPVGSQAYIFGYLIRWRNSCVLQFLESE